MGYDPNFYKRYAEYLKEDNVRTSHDFAFSQFERLAGKKLWFVDLGCGLGEYWKHGSPFAYTGVDVNDPKVGFKFIQGDYHDLRALKLELSRNRITNAFVSLFSIECFHSAPEKYAFYHRVFEVFPSIRFGLVSGFFYESKRNQETVGETGGIVSYQTIEDQSLYVSNVFTELRMHIRTPSQMFGQDVVEVWKFFIRR